MSKWLVFPALHEEAKEGWVWVSLLDDPTTPHVQLKNPTNGLRVVCEQRLIDSNFRRVYKEKTKADLPQDCDMVVVSAYYRERLGISLSKPDPIDLEVLPSRGPIAGLRAGRAHPSSAIRTATWLGILSLVLGILSVVLALLIPRLEARLLAMGRGEARRLGVPWSTVMRWKRRLRLGLPQTNGHGGRAPEGLRQSLSA